ncbi:hypothetical protein EV182_001340 [Spiromyces aspiralis]|uniref:Uncharacterized protein n=1 Tax=Spiromyces aspiralis TaxID=68401 RepID=A0ACC1HFR1_9FUNG|nr:hypothetical protein EV182_001340 [Spiromyces aspiralis]
MARNGKHKSKELPRLGANTKAASAPGVSNAQNSPIEDRLFGAAEGGTNDIPGFFTRHRALTVLAAWASMYFLDKLDVLPIELFFFTFFSASLFANTFGVSAVVFYTLATAISAISVAVMHFVPYVATSFLSSVVVYSFLTWELHGLDSVGIAMTAAMALGRLATPWCSLVPSAVRRLIAAYCTTFGAFWLAYKNISQVPSCIDILCGLFGIVPPAPPRVTISQVTDTSVCLMWDAGEPSGVSKSSLSHAGGLVERYEVEVNNRIVGGCGCFERSLLISGLEPGSLHRFRLWSISTDGCRSPSDPTLVRTNSRAEASVDNGDDSIPTSPNTDRLIVKAGMPLKELQSLREEIEAISRSAAEAETAAEVIQARVDEKRDLVQQQLHELREKKRTIEEKQASQKQVIQELKDEKRAVEQQRSSLEQEVRAVSLQKKKRLSDAKRRESRRAKRSADLDKLKQEIQKEGAEFQRCKGSLDNAIESAKQEISEMRGRLIEASKEKRELEEQVEHKRKTLEDQRAKSAQLEEKMRRLLKEKRKSLDAPRPAPAVLMDSSKPLRQATTPITSSELATARPGRRSPAHGVGSGDWARRLENRKSFDMIPRQLCKDLGPSGLSQTSVGGGAVYAPLLPQQALLRQKQNHRDTLYRQKPGPNSHPALPYSRTAGDGLSALTAVASPSLLSQSYHQTAVVDVQQQQQPLALGKAASYGTSVPSVPVVNPSPLGAGVTAFSGAPHINNAQSAREGGIPSVVAAPRFSPLPVPQRVTLMQSMVGPSAVSATPAMSAAASTSSRSSMLSVIPRSPSTAESSAFSILKDTDLAYPTPDRSRFSWGASPLREESSISTTSVDFTRLVGRRSVSPHKPFGEDTFESSRPQLTMSRFHTYFVQSKHSPPDGGLAAGRYGMPPGLDNHAQAASKQIQQHLDGNLEEQHQHQQRQQSALEMTTGILSPPSHSEDDLRLVHHCQSSDRAMEAAHCDLDA